MKAKLQAAKSILVGLVALPLFALTAPLELLAWRRGVQRHKTLPRREAPNAYVVFFGGIADGRRSELRVRRLGKVLNEALPGAAIIEGLRPYSVTGRGLKRDAPLAPFWRWADRRRSKLGFLINLRNFTQAAVAYDRRYLELYHRAVFETLVAALRAYGYVRGDGTPIILVGYSGGAQIAAGVGLELAREFGAQVGLVSVGGPLRADTEVGHFSVVHHISSKADFVEATGARLFALGRRQAGSGRWERARGSGRVIFRDLSPATHSDRNSYFSRARAPDGGSFAEHTVAVIAEAWRALTPAALPYRATHPITPAAGGKKPSPLTESEHPGR